MKKIKTVSILTFFSFVFLFSFSAIAENILVVSNNEITGTTVYPSQWDIEVLDFTLKPAEYDILNALTVRNIGSAYYYYFEEIVLYEDDGDGVFEGWKRDIEISKGIYYDPNNVWHWKDLNVTVPKEGKRFFMAVETKKNGNIAVDRRTIQMGISPQVDSNGDGIFDFGTDTGIFMNSKNNGPAEGILNTGIHTIYKRSVDSLAPVSLITYPADEKIITENNLIMLGASRDQGGSTPSFVQVNIAKQGEINNIWSNVIATGENYMTWKYEWNNIEDGAYDIKIKTSDWIGNTSEESEITVTVDTTTIPSPTPSPSPSPIPTPTPISTKKPAGVGDGDLIRIEGDYKVYIVMGNYRRWIQSADIFTFYSHLGFSIVKEVTKEELESYMESWLIRAEGDKKVYEINGDGTKHWINMSVEQFIISGRLWDMVYIVNSQERNFYKTGSDVLK